MFICTRCHVIQLSKHSHIFVWQQLITLEAVASTVVLSEAVTINLARVMFVLKGVDRLFHTLQLYL